VKTSTSWGGRWDVNGLGNMGKHGEKKNHQGRNKRKIDIIKVGNIIVKACLLFQSRRE
jgi:hypothetical protein